MTRNSSLAVLVGFATLASFAVDASAFYHPGLGRWTSRDYGPGPAVPIGAARPAAVGSFIPMDQYADGMNLYQYVGGKPIRYVDTSGLWGADLHRDLTTELAKKAGIACPEVIGNWANAPDEDERAAPSSLITANSLRATAPPVGAGTAYAEADRLVKQAAEWHFPAGPDGIVRPGSARARAKINAGLGSCDLHAFSEGLHTLQDSWSHQGKPYTEGLGHARAKVVLKVPDAGNLGPDMYGQIYPTYKEQTFIVGGIRAFLSYSADSVRDWPQDARATGLATYRALRHFRTKCPCACPQAGTSGLPSNAPTSSGKAATIPVVEGYLRARFPD